MGSTPAVDRCLLPPGTTSIAAIELIFDLEDEFGIEFPRETVDASLFDSRMHLEGVLSALVSAVESARPAESTP